MRLTRTRMVTRIGRWLGALWLTVGVAAAQDLSETGLPVLLTADELTFNEELELATASGNVEITQGERVLLADTLTFNQRTNAVTASGNVVLMEPSGEVIFAEFVEMTDDMREGFIRQFRMLLQDDSRLAAVSGRRIGGVETQLDKAVYSPCRECVGHDQQIPLWRIRASRIVHNQETRDIVYRNARLEIAGLPVLYTPYLRHPDPTVKRRSGILTPRFGASSDLGTTLIVPYFWVIGDDKDVTIDPILTTKENILGQGEYRQAFNNGEIRLRAGATLNEIDAGEDRFRGYTDSAARFDLSSTWRAGADVKLVTDDTFLNRYGISSADSLTSRVFAEGFRRRDYARAEGLYFQGLRDEDEQDKIPIVAPKIDYDLQSEPNRVGAQWLFSSENFALTRADGTDSRRISMTGGWRLPYVGPLGDIYTLHASVQGDLYHVNSVVQGDGTTENGLAGRLFPQVSLEWRYPWVRSGRRLSQHIEPIVQLVAAPNGGNPGDIPNEDSLIFELDETNLFNRNRFVGRDRVEGGQRVAYGLRFGLFGLGGGSASALVGQSYRFREDDTFAIGSGLEDHFSDLVGRIQISPNRFGSLRYKTRLDKDKFSFRRNELQIALGPPALNLNASYLFFAEDGEFAEEREELNVSLNSNLTNQWSASIRTLRDLQNDDTLSYGASLTYTCDCLIFNVQYQRRFFRDRDVTPSDEFFVRVDFKNLGTLQSRVF